MWCSNHLCEAAILQRTQQIHADKLRTMKAQIDMRDPRRPKASNSKGARLEEERNARIMHENTILLTKLSKILTREGSSQAGTLPAAGPVGPRSLHDGYKRREREKIDRENQQLLRRLQFMKPCIDVMQFEQSWQEHAERADRARLNGAGANPLLMGNRGVPASAGRRRPVPRPHIGARPATTAGYVRPHHVQTYLEPLSLGPAAAPADAPAAAPTEGSAPAPAAEAS